MELEHLRLRPEDLNLSENETKDIKQLLAHPQVKKYLKILLMSSYEQFFENESAKPDEQAALVQYFNKLKGVQYLATFLLNNFQVAENKPQEKAK